MADGLPPPPRPPHPGADLQRRVPRYARNPGTGEPHATATTLLPADQEVSHDPSRPSALILPVREPHQGAVEMPVSGRDAL